jgi:hypothetical protein
LAHASCLPPASAYGIMRRFATRWAVYV